MASPSLHGVPRDGSPASTILWDAPTPRRPSRPVRILHEPIPSCRPWFAPLGRGRPTGGQGVVGSGLPIRIDDGNVGVSQVPWKPWWSLSVLFDPGRIRQAEWTKSKLPDTAPAWVHDERSRRLVLSGLNHTTFDLTVYASQGWSPTRHARLASGCWSSSTGRDWLPAGFHLKGFKLPTILLSRASWREVRPSFKFNLKLGLTPRPWRYGPHSFQGTALSRASSKRTCSAVIGACSGSRRDHGLGDREVDVHSFNITHLIPSAQAISAILPLFNDWPRRIAHPRNLIPDRMSAKLCLLCSTGPGKTTRQPSRLSLKGSGSRVG